jgi:hypothetical protein
MKFKCKLAISFCVLQVFHIVTLMDQKLGTLSEGTFFLKFVRISNRGGNKWRLWAYNHSGKFLLRLNSSLCINPSTLSNRTISYSILINLFTLFIRFNRYSLWSISTFYLAKIIQKLGKLSILVALGLSENWLWEPKKF